MAELRNPVPLSESLMQTYIWGDSVQALVDPQVNPDVRSEAQAALVQCSPRDVLSLSSRLLTGLGGTDERWNNQRRRGALQLLRMLPYEEKEVDASAIVTNYANVVLEQGEQQRDVERIGELLEAGEILLDALPHADNRGRIFTVWYQIGAQRRTDWENLQPQLELLRTKIYGGESSLDEKEEVEVPVVEVVFDASVARDDPPTVASVVLAHADISAMQRTYVEKLSGVTLEDLAVLTARERDVVEMYLGLDGIPPRSQDEIVRALGISLATVRSSLSKAKRRLTSEDKRAYRVTRQKGIEAITDEQLAGLTERQFEVVTLSLGMDRGNVPRSYQEVADMLGVTKQRVQHLLDTVVPAPATGVSEKKRYVPRVPQERDMDEKIDRLYKTLRAGEGDLTERERSLLEAYFLRGLTLAEISDEFGMSRETLRVIKNGALEKLGVGGVRIYNRKRPN